MEHDTDRFPAWLQTMARQHLRIRGFEAGETLRHEGEVEVLLLILIEGRVKAQASDLDGRDVVFATYGPGDCVGDPCFAGQPCLASLVATTRGRCAVFSQCDLQLAQALYPELPAYLLQQAQRAVRGLQVQVTRMALMNVQQRVLALLQDLALPSLAGEPRPLREALTHIDIAARVGCTREMVGRALALLAEEGRILRRDRQVLVLPRQAPRQTLNAIRRAGWSCSSAAA